MLFVISGPSYVGKKTAIAHFMKLYSFSSVIPYTTKPSEHRVGETEGIQYHYVEESSRNDIANDGFIYDEPFNFDKYHETTLYAYRKSDILNAIESYSNFIIHASVGNVEKMYAAFSQYHRNPGKDNSSWTQQLYFIFLDYTSQLTKDFLRARIPKLNEAAPIDRKEKNAGRNGDNTEKPVVSTSDLNRRYSHSIKEIEFYSKHSNIFDAKVNSDKAYEICEKLEGVILPKLKVRPSSPDKIPGPLSNMDIIYMCENRKNDPLEVYINGTKAGASVIEKLLCGCGLQISLSNHIRIIRRRILNSFIDMADDDSNMEMILSKVYPEVAINKGYTLRPHEMILCTSDEYIKLPHDVYAMVASKFSYTQLGLSIELSPNVIQSGHNGQIHFQIKNNTDNYICIYPHIQVAQLLFFRTILPSTKKYFDDENHSYDREKIPPLPKFREGNKTLDMAKRPHAGVIKGIILQLKDKLIIVAVGFIALILAALLWAPKFNELINNYVIPVGTTLLTNLPDALLVALFAITSCAVNCAVYIVGSCVLHVLRFISYFMNRKYREKDD